MEAKLNHICAILYFLLAVVSCEETQKTAHSQCQGTQHAYTTMMKYPDGLEVDEGPYCQCIDQVQPKTVWNPDDGKSLTWQHYERAHWTVQYKFCDVKFDANKLRMCEPGERAAVMQTETTEWKVHLDAARCRCPNNLFQLHSWRREKNLWRYYYTCEKPVCVEKNAVCARIDVTENRKEDKLDVQEVNFFCACPETYMCPAKVLDADKEEVRETKATFIEKRCESIRQTGKEKNR